MSSSHLEKLKTNPPQCKGHDSPDQEKALLSMWENVLDINHPFLEHVGHYMEYDDSRQEIKKVEVGHVYYYDNSGVCALSLSDEDGFVWACTGPVIVQLPWEGEFFHV